MTVPHEFQTKLTVWASRARMAADRLEEREHRERRRDPYTGVVSYEASALVRLLRQDADDMERTADEIGRLSAGAHQGPGPDSF